jgi:peptide/nickel transport system ATP-binding protein
VTHPAASPAPLLAVDALRVSFPGAPGRPVRAVDGVAFTVDAGETVCLVGESGCGKSLTALACLGLVPEPGGIEAGSRVTFQGVELLALPEGQRRALRGNRLALVFQEPMTALNPVLTVGDQVAEVVRVHAKASRREAWARAVAMLERVGVGDAAARARQYPHELSGGLRQRVLIAMALVMGPALLIADEPTTALDVTIQAQVLALLRTLRADTGMGLLLITHDLGVVAEMADRVVVMYAGRVVEEGPVAALFAAPAHPYTRGLLAAMPRLDTPDAPLAAIPGTVPAPGQWPSGCPFRDRCAHATAACAAAEPALHQVTPGHRARCHLVAPAAAGSGA